MKNTTTTTKLIERSDLQGFNLRVEKSWFHFWDKNESRHPVYSCRGEIMAKDFVLHIEGKQRLVI